MNLQAFVYDCTILPCLIKSVIILWGLKVQDHNEILNIVAKQKQKKSYMLRTQEVNQSLHRDRITDTKLAI